MIDIDAERAQTPGCTDKIFLDSAGSSLPPNRVVDAMTSHLRREAEIGGYRAAAERAEELAALPASLARMIGAQPDLIALTDSATRSWLQFVSALRWQPGDRILISGNEYASNAIALLQRARVDGVVVEAVPVGPTGDVDLAALAEVLDDRVRLVSLVHVGTNSGRVAQVREVVDLAHRAGALVVLDGCQSAGQLAIDVGALGVDAFTASGRKWLRGPRGTGFLYVRREALHGLEPIGADLRGATWTGPDRYELRDDAARFELWENDVSGRLGLKEAVDHLLDLGTDQVETAVRERAAYLRSGLGAVSGVTIQDLGSDLCGLVTFTVNGHQPAQVRDELLAAGVTVSVSEAPSTLLEMEARGLPAVVRASPHYFVSPEQLDQAVLAVEEIARR